MEVFHGYQFEEWIKQRLSNALLERAITMGIITQEGAAYYRGLGGLEC